MKYLAIFQLAGSESAASFTSKKAAEEFIKTCATLAKAKLTTLDDTYTLRTSRKNPIEITASVSPIDTTIEYQLTHDRDGATLDTTYYTTRRSAVSAAHKILDQLGFVAGSGEDEAGTWAVNNPEQNLNVLLRLRLVVTGSDHNVVSSYDACDLEYFFQHLDAEYNNLETANAIAADTAIKSGRKKGLVNFGLGLAISAVGGLLTFISYSSAKPGDRYTVYTGLIVVGIIEALCGIYYLINPKAALPKDQRPKKHQK